MEHLSLWIQAFAGLGLFLFGMLYLEAQVKASAGRAFKSRVQKSTSTTFKSLLTGLSATALFQSSSIVSLMALSLIGAQLINLESAIAMLFGSNIGSTLTVWIIGLVGFKMDIKLIAYLFIGIGGLGGILTDSNSRWKSHFGALVGFGLIFLGLEGMKESFSTFAESFNIASYSPDNIYWFALIGLGITAVIQASSAAIAIVQSALFAQLISIEAAAAFVVGANIGTTITVVLGSFGGTSDKKRTALAHLFFNFSTGFVALLALQPLVWMAVHIMPSADTVIQIALFHTLFNVMGVALWYPFISHLTQWLQRFFKKEPEHVTKYLYKVPVDIPDVALDALKNEVRHLGKKIEEFALLAINIPPPKALEKGVSVKKILDRYPENMELTYDKLYEHIRLLEGKIFRYISLLSQKNTEAGFQEHLNIVAQKTAYLATAAKTIKDMLYDIELLYNAKSSEEQTFLRNLRYQILNSVQVFENVCNNDQTIEAMEEVYKQIAASNKNNMTLIHDIMTNQSIPSEMSTIAINDLHLSKSFTKALRNALRLQIEPSLQNRDQQPLDENSLTKK
ncbi:MAG: Na/Pi symporter [Helicobacteraceae bacterium]|jgi:phosphate:Na+ symporter|nr:Na/Pi symporter [Helicobacteraceae bacterium]